MIRDPDWKNDLDSDPDKAYPDPQHCSELLIPIQNRSVESRSRNFSPESHPSYEHIILYRTYLRRNHRLLLIFMIIFTWLGGFINPLKFF